MLVTLIGQKAIYKLKLPKVITGNYWLTDQNNENGKKLINIEGKNGKWQIASSNYAQVINPQYIEISNNQIQIPTTPEKILNKIILQEYSMYGITMGNSNEFFILYCSPIFEDDLYHLTMKNTKEILIGNGTENHISYDNKLVSKTHAKLYMEDGHWTIQNLDPKFGTFVNNKPVPKEGTKLFNGDVIFIMGLKIIIMGNSVYINNPLNNASYNSQKFIINKQKQNITTDKIKENDNTEIYAEKDYFFRSPRITSKIEKERVKIDAPPQMQDKEEMPMILTLGTSLTMGLMMVVSMSSAINSQMSGNAALKDTLVSLSVSMLMIIGIILFPILTMRYEKKRKVKYEKKRQTRYKNYLNSKVNTIEKIMNKQRKILSETYVPLEECANIIINRKNRLWERKIEDHDFLSIRLGTGDLPLNIDIQYPEEGFVMEDDNLVDTLQNIAEKSKTLKNAPITISLAEKNVSALISKDNEKIRKFMQNILTQIVAFQSYEDLKLVFLLSKDTQKKWEYVKMLPHVWNNTKQMRFFADNLSDMEEISRYLEEELVNRRSYEEKNYKSFMPYYLIITDDYKKIAKLRIITEILKSKINVGFSIFCITNDLMQLPNECKTFIDIDNEYGRIFESEISSTNQLNFEYDASEEIYFEKICQTVSNIPIKYTASGSMLLPNTYTFLEMYDVGLIEQLNVLERWKTNDATLSLQAPIGIDDSGRLISLDIHEKFHGPHGLIAGATGSGKSEFIITYILSLAINYHPDDLTFILIDYKGGGLAGAFQKREIKLPHLVGTITNIDTIGLQRSLASIQSELKRRQIIFNEARNVTDEGTIDIYKYQKLYHQGIVDKPVPHLLIICDEFAELKQQQEEFMNELISVSRIGRSLGVHLILATQKPAGIVNDQIRSNSKFAVCLKVQDTEDSTDVIKRPDAANLKSTGQFYLQVGNDEYFTLGQSAWSGAAYVPSDVAKKKEDNSIEIISNIGTVIKTADDTAQKIISSEGEQLTNIVRYLYELAKQQNIKAQQLWLDSIPETIFIDDIRKKYNIKKEKNKVDIIIGEYDDPANQEQGPVEINPAEQGNIIVYGNAESGKETLLSSVVYDSMQNYSTEELWLYILDFGSEAFKIFKGAPHVGDVIFINEAEKITRFFKMMKDEIQERKKILSDYSGDYELYLNSSNKPMPRIIIIVNNYETFNENYEDEDEYEDMFANLTREGIRCGISFIITTSNYSDLRYRLAQNFKKRIALQLNNEDDYYNIFDNVGKKRPSNIFGRGLITLNDGNIYEFQTAKICNPEDWNITVREKIEKQKQTNKLIATPIPILPEKVTFEDLKPYMEDISAIPIGISKKDIKPYIYDFTTQYITIISGKKTNEPIIFVSHIIEEMGTLEDVNITILDAERTRKNKINDLIDEYNKFMKNINTKKNSKEYNICVIIGIDKFITNIEDGEERITQMLKAADDLDGYSFIIVDSASKIKAYEYESWYKSYIVNDNAIWVGSGINDQYLINMNSYDRSLENSCSSNFGYVIKNGEPTLIKLLEMKEKGDDDE